ncbi:hypothetical protein [Geobacillus thermocatenulatus]|uniref:hypothetical protein n=1 Tax=Geobacillus thermocatenulatus TaxID=33938 RepID=UPI002013037F|nr:hypothetical protein [Geobacillus thermocatenulatus]
MRATWSEAGRQKQVPTYGHHAHVSVFGAVNVLNGVAHVLLTRPPLTKREQAPVRSARLACIRHAASVRPEPGSNSPKES